jgi:hypothetical protein
MSVSTQVAPRQLSFGRFPTAALAMLALVVVIAAAVALVALNGSKTAATSTSTGFGHGPGDWYYTAPVAPAVGAPPLGYDHGSSNGQTVILPKTISHFGGWAGPALKDENFVSKDVLEQTKDNGGAGRLTGTGAGHNGTRRAQ